MKLNGTKIFKRKHSKDDYKYAFIARSRGEYLKDDGWWGTKKEEAFVGSYEKIVEKIGKHSWRLDRGVKIQRVFVPKSEVSEENSSS